MDTESFIYESPDGGKTVYKRKTGESYRQLHYTNTHAELQESQLWGNIHRAARTNPALQEALERVKITYYLSKEYEERHGRSKT